jgi:hypothetical protein
LKKNNYLCLFIAAQFMVAPCFFAALHHFLTPPPNLNYRMKNIICLLCFWFIGLGVYAQHLDSFFAYERNIISASLPDSMRTALQQAGYSAASAVQHGLIMVRKDDYWGCINQSGKLIIPCQYGYLKLIDNTCIIANSEGRMEAFWSMSWFAVNPLPLIQGGKWGIFDWAGKAVLPFEYRHMYTSGAFVAVSLIDEITQEETMAIWHTVKRKFVTDFGIYTFMGQFKDGKAELHGKKNGYIDTNGIVTHTD